MLVVAALAARAGSTPAAMITATRRWTGSAANAGSRSAWFSRPAIFDHQASALNVAGLVQTSPDASDSGDPTLKYPITGMASCCPARRERPRGRRAAEQR